MARVFLQSLAIGLVAFALTSFMFDFGIIERIGVALLAAMQMGGALPELGRWLGRKLFAVSD